VCSTIWGSFTSLRLHVCHLCHLYRDHPGSGAGFSEAVAGNFWSWVGFLSLFSGPVFGTLSDKLGRKAGLIIVFFLQMLAYLLVATKLPGVSFISPSGFMGLLPGAYPRSWLRQWAIMWAHTRQDRHSVRHLYLRFRPDHRPCNGGDPRGKNRSFSGSFSMAAVLAGIAIVLTVFLKKPR